MKKFFCAVLLLFLFVSVSCYANDETDMFLDEIDAWNELGSSPEWNSSVNEMLESMKDLYKDASPEEKAILRKGLEEQMNNTLALMELKYKEHAKSATPEQKKMLEDTWKKQKQLTEQSYRETIKAMGL